MRKLTEGGEGRPPTAMFALSLELRQRERTERESTSIRTGPSRFKDYSWEDIGRAYGIRPAAFSSDFRDDHRTRRPVRIGEEHPVSQSQPRQPLLGHGHYGIRRPGCNFWTRGWRQPNSCRRNHAAERVPLRAILQHSRSRLDRPFAQYNPSTTAKSRQVIFRQFPSEKWRLSPGNLRLCSFLAATAKRLHATVISYKLSVGWEIETEVPVRTAPKGRQT